jgi:hypothetical protein
VQHRLSTLVGSTQHARDRVLTASCSAGKDDTHLAAYLTLRRLALWLDSPMQLLRQMCVLLDATESQQVCAHHGICRELHGAGCCRPQSVVQKKTTPLPMRLPECMVAVMYLPSLFLGCACECKLQTAYNCCRVDSCSRRCICTAAMGRQPLRHWQTACCCRWACTCA